MSTDGRTGKRKALHGQPRRFVAAALATALSVGFVTSTLLVVASARGGIEQAVGAQYERADVVLGPDGAEDADPTLIDTIMSVPRVETVAVTRSAYAEASWAGSARRRPISLDLLATDPALQWQHAVDGSLPTSPDEIAIEAQRAEASRLGVGSTLDMIDTDGRIHVIKVVGLYTGSSLTDGGYLMTDEGGRAIDSYATVREVLVRADSRVDPTALAGTIASVVGSQWAVSTADARATDVVAGLTGDVDVLGIFLLGFAAVALVVAALVIANTFVIVLAQRTRELALLRCVGAGRLQVFAAVVGQAAVLGLVAGVAGVLGGVGLAAGIVGLSDRVDLAFPVSGLTITPWTLLAPLLAGVLVSVLASIVPAYRATKVAPVAALQLTRVAAARSRSGVVRIVLALGAIGLGGALLGVGAISGTLPLGLVGGVVSFLGVLLAGPLLLPALVRLIGYLPARTGLPARLARVDAVRNPGRTAATSSALLIGVTLIATMTVGAASMERSVTASLDQQLPVDLIIDAAGTGLPADLVADLAAVDDVDSAVGLIGADGMVDATPVHLLGVDPAGGTNVVRGDMISRLEDGVVLVPPITADELGLVDGESVRLGSLDLVVSTFYGLDTPDLLVTAADLERIEPGAPVAAVWARAAPGASPLHLVDAAERLVADVPDAEVNGGLSLRAGYQSIFEVLLRVATILLGVAVLIALVGVGNTLSLSVLERIREHGLLRALGVTRGQLASMLGMEAALMALAAAVLGLGLGIAYGFAGTMTVLGAATGEVVLVVPPLRFAVIIVIAAFAGLAASVLPARRAARTSPVAALAQD